MVYWGLKEFRLVRVFIFDMVFNFEVYKSCVATLYKAALGRMVP